MVSIAILSKDYLFMALFKRIVDISLELDKFLII